MKWDRIAVALAVGSAIGPAGARAQTVREVRGSLMGIASGWVGTAVSIPYLKIGTLAGEHGTFRLKTTAPAGCYEMVLRARGFRKTYYRFELPDSSLDLGAIPHLYCPEDLGTGRAVSDSNGVITFALRLQFPQEQALADGGLAACQIRNFLPSSIRY